MCTIVDRFCGECDEVVQHSLIVSNPFSVHTVLDGVLEDWKCLDCGNAYREVQLVYPLESELPE